MTGAVDDETGLLTGYFYVPRATLQIKLYDFQFSNGPSGGNTGVRLELIGCEADGKNESDFPIQI